MASNPLLGKRLSLISKKNIRYEGVLYSINEQNSTVALHNVKSYGTEGRPTDLFVAPSNDQHAFLLFRGEDIKDLHVHDETTAAAAASTATASSAPPAAPPASDLPPPPAPSRPKTAAEVVASGSAAPTAAASSSMVTAAAAASNRAAPPAASSKANKTTAPTPGRNHSGRGGGNNSNRAKSRNNTVGTGASLLNARECGGAACNSASVFASDTDYDFEGKLQEFQEKADDDDNDNVGDDDNNNADAAPQLPKSYYAKDDFFDSISCDATDKQAGVDHRIKGAQERKINTETFGAVALQNTRNNSRRYGGRGGRGSGNSGRSGGRGRGEGGGGRGDGNNSWRSSGGGARGRSGGGRGRSNAPRAAATTTTTTTAT